jgi:Uma2 family endonuclease
MGDTDYHNVALALLKQALEDFFADRPNVYVASNLLFYYRQGDPSGRRDPDVLVAKGVGKHRRLSFRVWEEKQFPCTLFEVASKKTWRNDLYKKRPLYAQLGIKEYFIFDPEGRFLDPVLQGFQLVKGESVALKAAADGSLLSKELGLRLVPEGEMLRLLDRQTGRPVPTRAERAEQEEQRADQEKQRADQEKQRADQEKLRAEQEKQRAAELAAEVERLRAQLAKRPPR